MVALGHGRLTWRIDSERAASIRAAEELRMCREKDIDVRV